MHLVFSGAVVEITTKGLVFSRKESNTSIRRGQLASNDIFIDHIIGIQQDKHDIALSGNQSTLYCDIPQRTRLFLALYILEAVWSEHQT